MSRERSNSMAVRLPNWVGDVIMSLPALQAMMDIGIELHLIGKPWIHDLLAATGLPLHSMEPSLVSSAKKIALQVDTKKALLLTNSFSSALMCRLARMAPIGYQTDNRRWLLTASLPKQPMQHEVHCFWTLARFACQHWFPHLKWPTQIPPNLTLPLRATTRAQAQHVLQRAHITKPFWVLCPFAHGLGKNKQIKVWPHWQALSAHLSHQHQLVVCPSKAEEPLCAQRVPEATMLPGLTLSEYAAVLAEAEQVISNDSGPLHMAAAVGTKTLGIFGVSDPHRTSPWGADYVGSVDHWPTLATIIQTLSDP